MRVVVLPGFRPCGRKLLKEENKMMMLRLEVGAGGPEEEEQRLEGSVEAGDWLWPLQEETAE